METNWSTGVISLRSGISLQKALEYICWQIICAIHYRGGLNNASNEESFTHSLAAGLAEFAIVNPSYWESVLSLLLPPEARKPQSSPGEMFSLPTSISLKGVQCSLELMDQAQARAFGAHGIYFPKQRKIQVDVSLGRGFSALILLHEVVHFAHDVYGVSSRTSFVDTIGLQQRALARLIKENPAFWLWWGASVATSNPRAAAQSPKFLRKAA